MAAAKEIRGKIESIKKTQKTTRAMEMVAASKMRKSQDRMRHSRPYAKKIYEVIQHVAMSHSQFNHPFLEHRDIKRVGYIVVSSDRGLCGGLNVNLFKALTKEVRAQQANNIEVDFCVIGRKGKAFFNRVGGNVVAAAEHLGDAPTVMDLIGVIKVMLDAFKEKKLDAVYIGFNEFVNTMTQKPVIQQLLPLKPAQEKSLQHYWDYIYEPDNEVIIDMLLNRYVESEVYQAVVENIACQQAATMVAMKAASDNAGDLIREFQLAYNKARQAAITQEIAEIVGGAAAV